MFDLKNFVAFAGIEDKFMLEFFKQAEAKGLNPRFDKYHVLEGTESPSIPEIEIMKNIYETLIVGSKFESSYETAFIDFPEKLKEKNRQRRELLKSK